MTMHERIASGKLFTDECEGLPQERTAAKLKMNAFNASSPADPEARMKLLADMLGAGEGIWVEPPFYFCYGTHIYIGEGSYVNFNCNFVDDGRITIGKAVMFGPAVTIATVGHPIRPDMRGYMYTAPVVIGDNCWIGAGSVVTQDIPADVVAVGNPCRVVRAIGPEDQTFYFRDRRIDPEDLAEEASLRKNP